MKTNLDYSREFAALLIECAGQQGFLDFADRFQSPYGFTNQNVMADYIQQVMNVPTDKVAFFLPDGHNNNGFVAATLIAGYEQLGTDKMPVVDPELAWLMNPAINRTEIARRMGLSAPLFNNKLKGTQYKKFSDEEIIKLAHIRQKLIDELRPGYAELSTDPPFVN